MYIQITNKCNMKCDHCVFSCTKRGSFMSLDTFEKACQIARDNGSFITIGGGEPTLHPDFLKILMVAINYQVESGSTWIATNGSNKFISLYLAELARNGVIGAALSQDVYHDDIDEDVISAFTVKSGYRHSDSDFREIRNVTKPFINLVNAGRAKSNHLGGVDDCLCDKMFIVPSGKVYGCGCKKHCFGTVDNYDIPEWYENLRSEGNGCCTKLYFRKAV